MLAHLGPEPVGWQLVVLGIQHLLDLGAAEDVHRVQKREGLVGKALPRHKVRMVV